MLIAFRRQLFDDVDERKIHRGVVPRLGGIAFLPSLMFSFCVVIAYNIRVGSMEIFEAFSVDVVPIFFLLCGLMLMYLCGMADDLIGVRYRAKFLFQIIVGILIVSSGLWLKNLDGFMGLGVLNYWVGWSLTVLLVIYVINAVNLIDGIDGLASGLSAITLIFYGYIFYVTEQYIYFILSGATLGTLIPFFYYNVFGNAANHKKIFMGDTGALTVGTMLVFFTLAVFNTPEELFPNGHNRFVVAIAPIMLPCFDVMRVFLHRVRNGNNPFLPDKCHIHHKLLAMGFPQWQALVMILLVDGMIVGFNMALSPRLDSTLLILGDILVWTAFNIVLTRLIRVRETSVGLKLYE